MDTSIHIHEFYINYDMLEKAMNLPPDTKLASIQEMDIPKQIRLTLVSTKDLPKEDGVYHSATFAEIGNVFREPDKYRIIVKGDIRGA